VFPPKSIEKAAVDPAQVQGGRALFPAALLPLSSARGLSCRLSPLFLDSAYNVGDVIAILCAKIKSLEAQLKAKGSL
jgi:hypothetical protein